MFNGENDISLYATLAAALLGLYVWFLVRDRTQHHDEPPYYPYFVPGTLSLYVLDSSSNSSSPLCQGLVTPFGTLTISGSISRQRKSRLKLGFNSAHC